MLHTISCIRDAKCDSIIKKSEAKFQKSSNENLSQHNWGNMGREAQGFLFSEPVKCQITSICVSPQYKEIMKKHDYIKTDD